MGLESPTDDDLPDDDLPGDEWIVDKIVDESMIAEVVQRLDNLWSDERQAAAFEMPNIVGRRIGKYTIRSVVGRGAFGVVYRATDDDLQRDVALKVPRPEVLVDRERLSRFQSEAVAASMLDHPAIVPVLEADLSGSTPYIVSTLFAGPDLSQWLAARSSPVIARNAAAFVAKLAEAVHYAHEKGILHRDLKPSNILLEPIEPQTGRTLLSDYHPRLSDFGLAKLRENGLQDTRSSLLVGTPLYMAPEQCSSDTRHFTPATDVYSLGVILYEMLTLHPPFEGTTYVEVLDKLRSKQPLPVRQLNPAVPSALETICAKCLEKDPAERYATAAELANDIQRFLKGDFIHARPPTWFGKLARWCRQPQRIATAGWFSCWYMSLSTIWMWLLWAAAASLGAMEGYVLKTLVDMVWITLFFSIPLVLIGWRVMRQKSRPLFWVATVFSAVHLAIIVHSLLQDGVVFSYIYSTRFSQLASYLMLGIGSLMQLGLYLLAIPAWWRGRKSYEY